MNKIPVFGGGSKKVTTSSAPVSDLPTWRPGMDAHQPFDPQGGPVKAWSASVLKQFETCPYAIKGKKVNRWPDPSGDAADRGTQIHQEAEDYVNGKLDKLPASLAKVKTLVTQLRDEYAQGRVELEGDWGFDIDWEKHDYFGPKIWLRAKLDVLHWQDETSVQVIDWKGLPLETPIPTPEGWTTMAELDVGDLVFDKEGAVTRVIGKSQVKHLDIYRLTFDDATTIDSDEEHLWYLTDGSIKTVTNLIPGDKLPLTQPLDLPEEYLPVDPYILGLWLGDGKHSDGSITISAGDYDALKKLIGQRGYKLSQVKPNNVGALSPTILGIRGKLSEIGVLANKHIPMPYLRSSIKQRLDLLRGLLDSDGNANPFRKQAVFTNTNERLARQAHELACSLGQRATLSPIRTMGFGKIVDAYFVQFRPQHFNPFNLPRKAELIKWENWGPGKSNRRTIRTIDPVESVPSQCIEVESSSDTYLCGKQFCVTHNSGKKFGNEFSHAQQGLIYAIATFMRHPQVQFAEVIFSYVDHGETLIQRYTRAQALALKPRLHKRAEDLTSCTKFIPKPSKKNCKWCNFSKSVEGAEPKCQYRYED